MREPAEEPATEPGAQVGPALTVPTVPARAARDDDGAVLPRSAREDGARAWGDDERDDDDDERLLRERPPHW